MEPTPECKEIFELLSQYLDLELPPEACEKIQAHIEGCAPCVEFAASLRKTVELCRRYRPAELPEPVGQQARQELWEAYRRAVSQSNA